MSSFDKTVKLACKPKAAPPKAKYLDPIIAATYSEDGTVHDVCRALAPRLREPNSIVVFKALIVLHTMIRNGATDNVLAYLSSEDVLKLRSVTAGHWDGYEAPKNLQNYALYLEARIRTYREVKHDPIRVQTDANRDMRVENEVESSRVTNTKKGNGPQRSKTLMGRKLRSMTVEKGLLRETKAVQKTIDALLECRLYLDNLEDDLNVTALRFLVKDLIVLFQALNEGVINVLEHYFEMSHVDAETALQIYRKFCKETETVVEYLGIARKLQNLLNIPIPNLKHAPVSLVKALEEYLNDPNFEQNRIEYKTAKASADKNAKVGSKSRSKDAASTSSNVPPQAAPSGSSSSAKPTSPEANQTLVDFFSSIEEEQSSMFAPSSQVPAQMQMATPHNPFATRQSMMMTGVPQQPFGVPTQMTGFVQPQRTGFDPFLQQQQQPFQQGPVQHPSHPPFSSFLQTQPSGFLQPQQTGFNPFRQSMMMPQMTGMPAFGGNLQDGSPSYQALSPPFAQPQAAPSISAGPTFSVFGPSSMANAQPPPPARPASTPATNSSAPMAKPLVTHQTGSRNPFGIPVEPLPPVPKPPTLQELAVGAFSKGPMSPSNQGAIGQAAATTPAAFDVNTPKQSTNLANGSAMAGVASSFTLGGSSSADASKPMSDMTGTSITSFSTNAFSSQPTGTTDMTSTFSFASSLQPQMTGFSGIKQFKPTSSFGAALLESLPPIQQHGSSTAPTTENSNPSGQSQPSFVPTSNTSAINTNNQPTSISSTSGFGSSPYPAKSASPLPSGLSASNAQSTGQPFSVPGGIGGSSSTFSSLGVGLRPQMTGGAANPFRASMYNPPAIGAGNSTFPPLPQTQFGSSAKQNSTGTPFFGNSALQGSSAEAQKAPNGVPSLI